MPVTLNQAQKGPAGETSTLPTRTQVAEAEYLKDQSRFSESLPTAPAEASSPHAFDVLRYDLKGSFDWDKLRLLATVDVSIKFAQNFEGALVLESKVLQVNAVRQKQGAAIPFVHDKLKNQLHIDLAAAGIRSSNNELTLSIDYEAGQSNSLRPVLARQGDPVSSSVVYTTAEPLGASRWMPCHNVPSDRALFSVQMKMNSNEALISNGDLVVDETDFDKRRTMSYQTKYPLPTYLMAFALGDFQVVSQKTGDFPVSIWARRGVQADYPMLLTELTKMMSTFEKLLTPYPFEKYAVVMLPDFPAGGIEHASISFQAESRTGQPALFGDLSLTAHELAHQWFGDYVSIESWDDLWIKEGMATLLANEAMRNDEDKTRSHILLGDLLAVNDGEAARDRGLSPGEKYTSGPYDRGAWILGQIRALVGEDNFWGTLKRVLRENAMGNVGSEEFLEYFRPLLGNAEFARVQSALDAKALPKIVVETGAESKQTLTLEDLSGALIVPFEFRFYKANNIHVNKPLALAQAVEFTDAALDSLLVMDTLDIHPPFRNFTRNQDLFAQHIEPWVLPQSSDLHPLFLSLPGVHQAQALLQGIPAFLEGKNFLNFQANLNSELARSLALQGYCQRLVQNQGAISDEDLAPLKQALHSWPPYRGLRSPFSKKEFAACVKLLRVDELFSQEYLSMEFNPEQPQVSELRLQYLTYFPLPLEKALRTWGAMAARGHSLRAKRIALAQLAKYANASALYKEYTTESDLIDLKHVYIKLLQSNEASELITPAISGAVALQKDSVSADSELLTALSQVLSNLKIRGSHFSAMCAARKVTKEASGVWDTFRLKVQDFTLDASVRAVLDDASQCD
jgi:hypothetical protein